MVIYCCSNDKDNCCPKKDTCKRYKKANVENHISTTLYKVACTKANKYVLYNKETESKEEK